MTSQSRKGDHTAIPAVLIGTALWILALVLLTFTQGVDAPAGAVWWWGVSLVGAASGLIGLIFLRWRRSRLVRSGRLS